jgi:hypothetical protein
MADLDDFAERFRPGLRQALHGGAHRKKNGWLRTSLGLEARVQLAATMRRIRNSRAPATVANRRIELGSGTVPFPFVVVV